MNDSYLNKKASTNDKYMIDNIEDLLSLAATIQEFLVHRKTGNENFKYTEQYVLATVLLHIKLQAKFLMPLQTATWLWPLMEIRQRQLLGESPCMRWLETMNKKIVISINLLLFLNLSPMK
ncbi:hypothetical protein RYX36_010132, partial [Vicia faba]